MNAFEPKVLGMTDTGAIVLGGFFTAHDTHGLHTDWFLPMFLMEGFELSIPYFACECLQHPNNDPDMIWPMLEVAYREAHREFNLDEMKRTLNEYLMFKWCSSGKPDLKTLSKSIMNELESNGKAFQSWNSSVQKILTNNDPSLRP